MRKQIIYSITAVGVTILLIAAMLLFAADQKARKEAAREEKKTVKVVHSEEPPITELLRETDDPFSRKLAYRQLSSEERKVYQELFHVLTDQKRGANVSTTDPGELKKVYQAVLSDNGNIFWVDGYRSEEHYRDKKMISLTFYPSYTCSIEDRQYYQDYIDEMVAEYLARVDRDASDYEKAKYVYEMLIYNVDYDLSIVENQNILSVFLWGRSVCSGFASAAQYMLTELDVPSMIIYGESMGEPHAWNLVYLDGEYYYMDTTWGNTASETLGDCSYEYFGLNDEQLSFTHKIEMEFQPPVCTGMKDNYYVHEGLYFNEFDEEKLGAYLAGEREKGKKTASVMFSDRALVERAKERMIDEHAIKDYCADMEQVKYVENKELHILSVDLTSGM